MFFDAMKEMLLALSELEREASDFLLCWLAVPTFNSFLAFPCGEGTSAVERSSDHRKL